MRAVGVVFTGVAQWYERPTFNRVVEGSIPSTGIIGKPRFPLNPSLLGGWVLLHFSQKWIQLSARVVKGGGLKIRCVMLRGFEPHLNYSRFGKGDVKKFSLWFQ